jgi:hypothetical protein
LRIADYIASPETGATKTATRLLTFLHIQANSVQLQGFQPAFYTTETASGFLLSDDNMHVKPSTLLARYA